MLCRWGCCGGWCAVAAHVPVKHLGIRGGPGTDIIEAMRVYSFIKVKGF